MTESRTLCVNGQRHFHRYLVKELSSPFDLQAWLDAQQMTPKCYWQGRDGVEYAACGSVLTLTQVPRFNSGNDSPARFWGGHAFFPDSAPKDEIWSTFPRCGFFLPKWEIKKEGKKTTLTLHALNGPLDETFDDTMGTYSENQMSLKEATHLPTVDHWTTLIQESLQKIQDSLFQKIVFARRSTHPLQSPLSPFSLLSKFPTKGGIRFAFQFSPGSTFLGVTPERLYKREKSQVFTEAVAGTFKRGKTDEEDAQLEKLLLEDPKNRHEFSLVKTSIEEGLAPLCRSLFCDAEDGVIKTPNVQHIHNAFEGILEPDISDDQILAALHPTAAMGGLPKQSALEYLKEAEPFERGWYASPLGYVSQEVAEFAVGIRSGLIEKDNLHLFAGAGIVSGSIAENEWEELEHKTALWKNL